MSRLILLVFLAILACPLWAIAAPTATDPAFQKQVAADTRAFSLLRGNLMRASDFARSRPDLFNPARDRKNALLAREDKLAVWNTWSSLLDSVAGLDQLRREHRKFDLFQDSERKNASFAIANASFLAEYRYALEFIALADRNPALDTVLNEAVPELGIPADTFNRFKFRFLNVAIASEFAALQVIGKTYAGGSPELQLAINDDSRVIWEMGKGRGHELTLKNALAVVQKSGFAAWFPLQKGVSEWMGDTKVARTHSHLISAKQVEGMGKRLQPGDIIFERHEWFLSNLGLPGFWTHVAFYIGTPEERRSYFNDPEVHEWVKGLGIADGEYESLLRQRYATTYSRSLIPKEDRHPTRILEAISEGVSFTSLEYTGSADSIAVIRPRLSKREKAQAIMRAFHYSGRPYDFNFDFQTDSALVCSELIFKAYEPGAGMKGMNFPVTEVMGRKVSTPNGMVRQFAEQNGGAAAQADFVLFLDGYEKEKRAVESTPEQFRASWQRPNWHILIQDAPLEAKKK
jgi:Permuted papain-like amidase enzyme, YaeF/YiiX, C92 family